jgi:hypothetical protein
MDALTTRTRPPRKGLGTSAGGRVDSGPGFPGGYSPQSRTLRQIPSIGGSSFHRRIGLEVARHLDLALRPAHNAHTGHFPRHFSRKIHRPGLRTTNFLVGTNRWAERIASDVTQIGPTLGKNGIT